MKNSLIILVFVCAFSCGIAGCTSKVSDQENLQGAWLAETESVNGIKRNVSYLYTFKEDTITFRDETGKEVKYSFKLDTAGNLKFLVIRSADTLTNPAPVSVGYALNGDSLKIVVAPAGLRPTEISDKNDQELIICKRKTAASK